MESILQWFNDLGYITYIALAFFSLGGSLVAVITAGFLSSQGVMDFKIVLIIGIVFNYIGDIILFYIGKYQKDIIIPYLKSHKRKLALSILILRKYGVIAIFIQKFLYGIKTLIPITMAISRFDFKKFIFYNIFASIFYVVTVLSISYLAGESIKGVIEVLKGNIWIPFAVVIFILTILYFIMKHILRNREIKKLNKVCK